MIIERIIKLGVDVLGHPLGAELIETRIREFEITIGQRLPEDYRECLLHFRTSFLFREYACFRFIEFPEWADKETYLSLDVFYGLNDATETLWNNYEVFYGRLPVSIVPIGATTFDSQVCLGVSGDEYGKVYFWDKDDEREIIGDRIHDFGNVYLLAESFSRFIESLFVAENNEVHPDPDDDELNESWILEDY